MEPLSVSNRLALGNNSFTWRFKRDWLDTVNRFAATARRLLAKSSNVDRDHAIVQTVLSTANDIIEQSGFVGE